jgi:hypothetical protein
MRPSKSVRLLSPTFSRMNTDITQHNRPWTNSPSRRCVEKIETLSERHLKKLVLIGCAGHCPVHQERSRRCNCNTGVTATY